MTQVFVLTEAMSYARNYAIVGLQSQPFHWILLHTLDQLSILDRELAENGSLNALDPERIDLGLMAAKEFGNDQAEFAHALHVIQREAEKKTG